MHKIVLFGLVAAVLLSGCATFPEPQQGSQTLVIGVAQYTGVSMPISFVNGTTRVGLKVDLLNLESQKVFSLTADRDGQFASAALPPGRYTVDLVFFKVTQNGTWYQSNFRPGKYGYHFVVEEGKVNNLGVLSWTQTYTGFLGNGRVAGDSRAVKYTTSSKFLVGSLYEDVEAGFAKGQPKSAWRDREWVNAAFD